VGLKLFFLFSQRLSASTCIEISSKLATFEMVSDKLGRWVPVCLSSTSSAHRFIFVAYWMVYQFLTWVFHVRMRFGLVVSRVWNQHFREFHQERVESRQWHSHFHCLGTSPDLKSLPNDQPMRSLWSISNLHRKLSQFYVDSVECFYGSSVIFVTRMHLQIKHSSFSDLGN
jgi:hypothetical protein